MATKFITISIEIMHDTNLNQSQKFILAEIEQLSQLDKGCIGSNKHFSDLIGITKENVSRNINELQNKGYIDVEIVKGTRNHTRIITLTTLVTPPYYNSKTPLLKQQETKENKTTNKTTNITIHDIMKIYSDKISSKQAKIKEALTFKELTFKKNDFSIIAIGLNNYAAHVKNENVEENYITSLPNFIKQKIYLDYQEIKKESNITNGLYTGSIY